MGEILLKKAATRHQSGISVEEVILVTFMREKCLFVSAHENLAATYFVFPH